jgi:Ser/Thr protein kinase RdoA (MazF antagonist)
MAIGCTGKTSGQHGMDRPEISDCGASEKVEKRMNDEKTHQILTDTLRRHYGLEGKLTRLGGENLNYRVDTIDGSTFVFKVVDQDMPSSVVAMEARVVEHAVKSDYPASLPRIIKNISGKIETRISIPGYSYERSRLIAFVPGVELHSFIDISDKVLFNIGSMVGLFSQIMKDFDDPAAHRSHRWNLTEVAQHRKSISLIEDHEKANLLRWAFDQWESRAAVHFDDLPWQFIHGDLNPENLMMEGDQVTGLVDFGDACMNPAVCDLAICLAYLMMNRDDPLAAVDVVLGGYEQVRPLTPLEHRVLMPLVCGRLAASIAVANERKLIDPSNPTWFGGEEKAWQLLARLDR